MSNQPEHLDLAAVRKRLENTRGRTFWRSLEELAGSAGFEEMMHREFPRYASEWENVEERRSFLKLMGASLALAGLTACTRQPTEQIVPYVRQPEDVVPGKPLFYATAMPLSGIATGLLVESHEGRPTKVEGNPAHPGSLGASDVYSQASVLGLYDPDRSQALAYRGEIRSWSGFRGALHDAIEGQKGKQGAGLRILTETITSPTLADQLRGILKDFPQAKWHQWEPAGAHSERAGAQLAFGQPVNTYYNLQNADVVVSLDSDFLASGPGSLRYARQFFSRRRIAGSQTEMNRLYVLEPFPSATGSKADHRFPVKAAEVEAFALALAKGLGAAVGGKVPQSEAFEKWGGPIIRDLQNHRGAGLVIAGEQQSPAVHALVHAMNQVLGNVGKTVFYSDAVDANPVDQAASLRELVKDLDSGTVEVLLILGGNPVFTAPVELGLKDRIQKAKLRVRLGLYEDETSAVCHWHVPETHFLETWSDARAFDGTVSIMQPLISPLYRGKSAHEVLALLSDAPDRSGYEIVKGYWQTQHPGADFEAWWRRAVHDGVIAGSALPAKTPALRAGWADGITPARNAGGLEVVFRPDAGIYDGRFANNGWLQEFPRPVHKLSWDNAAFLSPATAARLSLKTGDLVELRYRNWKLRAPVYIQPGQADGVTALHLGFGRYKGGHVAEGIGFSPYGIRSGDALWRDSGVELSKVGDDYPFASVQNFHILEENRHAIRHADIEEYRKNPEVTNEGAEAPPRELTLYPDFPYKGYAWGMAIDLNACTGCGACIVACQAENNIPVVGKDQVRRGRDMHWIRVDSYYKGSPGTPEIYNQPVPCQQCEDAPCELVCPVQATSHSSEGLNDMVYNRCVGTRYCANNCPYKVRRFNFLLFSDFSTPSLTLLHNPDVTVRSRGVMEKCTYCVQRINYAKIEAEKEDRKVRDGDIQTACQASCPTEAIIFGDTNDPNSRVSKMKGEKRNYGLLAELNTRPRTTYLATLRNPNPEIES